MSAAFVLRIQETRKTRWCAVLMVLTVIWILQANALSAEEVGYITGVVKDESSGKPLAWANIVVVGSELGCAADEDGGYVIENLPVGTHEIKISMIGYRPVTRDVVVRAGAGTVIEEALTAVAIPMQEVVVSGEKTAEKTSVSTQIVGGKELRRLHGVVEDPMKVLHTLPGIAGVTGGEEFAGIICVRGGDPGENLHLLDWAKVHWPWHMGGMKSFFNSELIEDIELLTGAFPAKYGDALSAVVNVTTREGKRDRIHGKGNLSIINALGVIEGPVGTSSSYILSARRSYFELVVREPGVSVPSFYDIQGKLTYDLSGQHKLLLSGLASGEDVHVEFEDPEPGQPESIEDHYRVYSASGQWKWLISPNIYSRLAYLGEKVKLHFGMSRIKMEIDAWTHGLREDVTHKHEAHELKYGFEVHRGMIDEISSLPLDPSDREAWIDTTAVLWHSEVRHRGWKGGAYLQDTWQLFAPLWLTGGGRYDHEWTGGESSLSPRLSVKYEVTPSTHIRSAWGHYYQSPQEATEFEEGESLKMERATHYVLGIERRLSPDVKGWIEAYRKDYSRLVTVDSARSYSNQGSGFSHGLELFLQKEGNPSSWLSYSLSLAKRREYLDAQEYYFDFDQRHMVSLVGNYRLGRLGLQVKWRYASGTPYTSVVGAIPDTSGCWIPVEGEKNSARNPAYHRLDVRLGTHFRVRGVNVGIHVEALNLYNHRNVMGYTYNEDYSEEEPYYGLPIIPSVGLSAEF